MRYLLFIAFSLLPFISHATSTRLEDGLEAYQNTNYRQAFDILLPLAQAGNVDAQLSIGTMYNKGQGVKQDSQKALKWYRLAADQGDYIAKSLILSLFSVKEIAEYQNNQSDTRSVTGINNTIYPVRSISNSLIYIAQFGVFLLVCFTLYYVLKPKKPAKKMPVFYPYTEKNEIEEEILDISILEETMENTVEEESLVSYFEPIQHINEPEVFKQVEKKEIVSKEKLFEYCYNNNAYDEEKLGDNPITKIQRRRYKGSFMEYCYEECYH